MSKLAAVSLANTQVLLSADECEENKRKSGGNEMNVEKKNLVCLTSFTVRVECFKGIVPSKL